MNVLQCDLLVFFKSLPTHAQYFINGIAGIVLYLISENAGATLGKALYFLSHT